MFDLILFEPLKFYLNIKYYFVCFEKTYKENIYLEKNIYTYK